MGVTPEQMREVKVKPGLKYVGTDIIFDIKLDGKFTHKAIPVAGRHKTAPPYSVTHYSVVTNESVILSFIISGMNNLDICACGIGNAYPNATCG